MKAERNRDAANGGEKKGVTQEKMHQAPKFGRRPP